MQLVSFLFYFRESSLLWNTIGAPNIYKKSVLAVIAHEFAHMWFGDLVTCEWWDYTFLNEGFARYFQYFTFTKVKHYFPRVIVSSVSPMFAELN